MSQITIVGNTTAPVEVRYTQSGRAVGSVTVAVNRKRGEVEEVDFHRVTLWQELAEHAAQLVKGTRVIVVGRLTSRGWETQEGEKRTGWEITADAFGPDLRWATAQVTRAAGNGGAAKPAAQTDQWPSADPGAPWDPSESEPF